MSYQVLARKWRPQVFDDVVGQGHITRTLQNAILSGRLAHAFLFSGPRGVGKTTTARILAKALNCIQGPTPTPCGKCDSCLETAAGTSVDVVEIDGASNRGIEHIRELREAVKYAPVGGKYKVYVIDEVHMLTNEAFNALLKTLEEPPPHVIFIFATTEPQKIPATIHSRCQRYGFKRVLLHDIVGRLRTIADTEGIKISDGGLAMIARAAEGSMRDSQSLLDQAVSYSGMEINDSDLQATLGTVAQERLLQFAASLLARDAGDLLKQVDALMEQGQDMRQFLSGMVEHLRNMMIVKIASEPGQIMELPTADIEAIRQQADKAEADQLLMLFDSLSKTLDDMRWSPHQRFTLEIGLIKACSLVPLQPLAEVLGRMKELETRLASGRQPLTTPAEASMRSHHKVRETPQPQSSVQSVRPSAAPSPLTAQGGEQEDVWGVIMKALKSKKPALASFLEHSSLLEDTDTILVLGVKGIFQVSQVEKRENLDIIEQAALEVLGRKVQVKVKPLGDAPKSDIKSKSPKKIKPEEQDPAVQDVLRIFPQGEVIEHDNSTD
ncbi:MAG TPA: DNA polymerase III subunit gamma/tau [Nitrospirota bacterium]|nr:DNA polymerase III subunit gamma/tau [Nitrospirota bacterium]